MIYIKHWGDKKNNSAMNIYIITWQYVIFNCKK